MIASSTHLPIATTTTVPNSMPTSILTQPPSNNSMIPIQKKPDGSPHSRRQVVTEPSASRVVSKPVPQSQVQDPRLYQIQQVRRRFSPKESTAADGAASLAFRIAPSDPDFPFELDYLECDLRVPEDYPEERPTLLVKNKGMPRGFSINVERGWDRLAEERKDATLLTLVHALDKNLEGFLSEQKAETVKLVAFRDTRHLDVQIPAAQSPKAAASVTETVKSEPSPRRYIPEPSYSREQITEAKSRRAQEIRQLEARMGRMPTFRRSADGIVFTLPIEPKRRNELPPGLQYVSSLHLIVPLLYPLQDIRVQLNEADSEDAEPLEELFVQRAAEQKQMTLMSHINYLAQSMHTLAKQAAAEKAKAEAKQPPTEQHTQEEMQIDSPEQLPTGKGNIQIIQRPPEWSLVAGDSEEESSSDDTDGGVAVEIAEEAGGQHQFHIPSEVPERGTMMSFPYIELHGIEILQVSILSITVKCERCKTSNDITGLKPGFEKTVICKKCSAPMAAKFQQQLVHENSTRAGFIDLSGCKVADMLPSSFIPTCARCSTPGLELVSVRGEAMTNVCRECHGKFTFKIPEVKFLFITPGTLPPPSVGPRRKQEKLGLHAGEPLPNRGACGHYRKSYRWFRFSCCSRVHACDRCHDDAEDHINEWANRMICGWCSREQNYAVEACGFCGRSVIGRKGKGFWEGGKGTRDQKLMSRKDPRKYRSLGGGQSSKKD